MSSADFMQTKVQIIHSMTKCYVKIPSSIFVKTKTYAVSGWVKQGDKSRNSRNSGQMSVICG